MMAGWHEGMGGYWPQDERLYPSGSSETEKGADWLTAHRDAEGDLPSGQGEGDIQQGAPAPTAAELRASLKKSG